MNIIGRGILKIEVGDLLKQLRTMESVHANSSKESLDAVAQFGKLFAGQVWDTYL